MKIPGSRFLAVLLAGAGLLAAPAAGAETYSFGVLSQHSAVPTAEYWNPILDYVQRRTGIALQLRVTRTAAESNDATARGEYDFVYSNQIFEPRMSAANYQVILRPRAEAIAGQIVTPAGSAVRRLADLAGREVGFPSPVAFVGYVVPMDRLRREGIAVKPVFGGNQEGIMGQLRAGRVAAAAVNDRVMKAFAEREHFRYRVLWESEPFHNLPIAAHPRVPREVIAAVRAAIDGMEGDAEGMQVLEASARVIGQSPPFGFRAATPADYRNYVDFYKRTPVTGGD